MGRNPRIHFEGALFHSWARGVDRRIVFTDDSDYSNFMDILERVLRSSSGRLIAFCLMPNHVHLLIQVGTIPLSEIMQRVLTAYAKRFNNRHGRVGHLFQERFSARLCADNDYLARLIPYIHRNPVRAGLVTSPTMWRWSSQYKFPVEAIDLTGFDPWDRFDEATVRLARKPTAERISLDDIIHSISSKFRVDSVSLRSASKFPNVVGARRIAVRRMFEAGYKASDIARFLGIAISSVTRFRPGRIAQLQNLTP